MNRNKWFIILLLTFLSTLAHAQHSPKQGDYFKKGKYGMFIHWGIYSSIGNHWKDSTYYGASEWVMSRHMANIPVDEYMQQATYFNPNDFDAKSIVALAKAAGMKYIIITSKHHDGFAMYDSESNEFNIVKATPYKKDPMRELAKECKEARIGFGFYYSHNRDWTFPGAVEGPEVDKKGNPQTFHDYFYKKCLPQVEEITTNYGQIEVIWFDTPGKIEKKYAQKLVAVVKKNQPNALISGRIGHGMGDYQTLGDMEIPVKNILGLWESIDVTNDSWGYAWYDKNWKTPQQIIHKLIASIARGGNFLLNVGPDGKGNIPDETVLSLKTAGNWINKHQDAIYEASASPWEHKMAWGDITKKENRLFLFVEKWPDNNVLYLPGLKSSVETSNFLADKKKIRVETKSTAEGLYIDLNNVEKNPLVSVIELVFDSPNIDVDKSLSVDTSLPSDFSILFADSVKNCTTLRDSRMEKFGEHKHHWSITSFKEGNTINWTFLFPKTGYYQVKLVYKSLQRPIWQIRNKNTTILLQNELGASSIYSEFDLGWIKIDNAGIHNLTLHLLNPEKCNPYLEKIVFSKINLDDKIH